MSELIGITTVVIVGFVVLFSAIFFPVVALDKHYTRINCVKFAEQSGFETKFADYNFATYECLAKRTDGKWVGSDKLRESDAQ